jgi:hypothetical protein
MEITDETTDKSLHLRHRESGQKPDKALENKAETQLS